MQMNKGGVFHHKTLLRKIHKISSLAMSPIDVAD